MSSVQRRLKRDIAQATGAEASRRHATTITALPVPVKDADLARSLAEAIRLTLIHAHYSGCRCNAELRNRCDTRRLEEAFRLYVNAHREEFSVI